MWLEKCIDWCNEEELVHYVTAVKICKLLRLGSASTNGSGSKSLKMMTEGQSSDSLTGAATSRKHATIHV